MPTPTSHAATSSRWSLAFLGRLAQFLAGLFGLGLGIATMLEAGIGLGPWGVFHDGIARVTPLSFGQALMAVGVVVLGLAWLWTGERPGPGTFVNMLVVGPTVDLVRASGWLPTPDALAWGVAQALVGVAIVGFASGVYITARFGAGPRDAFVLGLSRVASWSIRRTRTAIELSVLAMGIVLGGAAGLGTVLFAFGIGPVMQASLRLFRALRPPPQPVAGD